MNQKRDQANANSKQWHITQSHRIKRTHQDGQSSTSRIEIASPKCTQMSGTTSNGALHSEQSRLRASSTQRVVNRELEFIS